MYASFDYYSKYYDSVTAEEFEKLAHIASTKLDVLTARRASKAAGYKAEAVKDACCALVNVIKQQQEAATHKGISSVSNDGYSEHYSHLSPEQEEEQLRAEAFKWLSGTGLMGAL